MADVMTQAQLRRIYNISGLYKDAWIDDDFVEDMARFIGAINAEGTAYDSTYDITLAVECIARVLARGVDKDRTGDLMALMRRLEGTAAGITTTILPPGGITEEDVEADISRHNTEVGRHAPDLDPIRIDITSIRAVLADLEADAGDIALIQARAQAVAMGGYNLQLSKDAGMTWTTFPGLPALGLAGFHHVPDLSNYLRNDQPIPTTIIASGPRAHGMRPTIVRDNLGNFSLQYVLPPQIRYLPNADNIGGLNYADTSLLFIYGGGSERVSLRERAGNAWHTRFNFPDERWHSGIIDPATDPTHASLVPVQNGEHYLYINNGVPDTLWLKVNNVLGLRGTFGQGGGGGGVTLAQVDGRITTLTNMFALVANTDPWLATKLLQSGTTGNNRAVFSNGTNLEGRIVPNWIWEPSVRITGGKLGAGWVNNSALYTINNVPTWLTYAQIIGVLKSALYTELAADSDQITFNSPDELVVTGETPTAAELLTRMNTAHFEISDGKIDVQFPTTAGNTLHYEWRKPSSDPSKLVLEYKGYTTSTHQWVASTALNPIYVSASSGGSVNIAGATDFSGVFDDEARLAGGGGTPGVSDYDDLTDKPMFNIANQASLPEADADTVGLTYRTRDRGEQWTGYEEPGEASTRIVNFAAFPTDTTGTSGVRFQGVVDDRSGLPDAPTVADEGKWWMRRDLLLHNQAPFVQVDSNGDFQNIAHSPDNGHPYIGVWTQEQSARNSHEITAAGQLAAFPRGGVYGLYEVGADFAAGSFGESHYGFVQSSVTRHLLERIRELEDATSIEVLHDAVARSRAALNWGWDNDLKFDLNRALTEADDDKQLDCEITFSYGGTPAITRHEEFSMSAKLFRNLAANALNAGSGEPPDYFAYGTLRLSTGAARGVYVTRNRHADGHDILRWFITGSGSNRAMNYSAVIKLKS